MINWPTLLWGTVVKFNDPLYGDLIGKIVGETRDKYCVSVRHTDPKEPQKHEYELEGKDLSGKVYLFYLDKDKVALFNG